MSDIAIKVEHLTKTYRLYDRNRDRIKEALNPFGTRYSRDFYALNDISFEIKKGETIGIIGKNGAGKSTLLKILTGVLTPTSGKVEVNGKVAALLELGAGFNFEMTGMENIYLNGTIMGYSKEEMDQKVQGILTFADIGEFINQPVRMYSSGMFARLAFAVAINVDPDILIVDEALSVGDQRFQMKCMNKMKSMMQGGTTVLFVSHDINAIRRFCSSAVWFNNGKIEAIGNTNKVADKYMDYLKAGIINVDSDVAIKNGEQSEELKISEPESDIAKLLSIQLINLQGDEISEINYDEYLAIKVKYKVNDLDVNHPVLGIALFSSDDEYMCGLNTLLDNIQIPWNIGDNEIKLEYNDGIRVLGGVYYFVMVLFEETATVPIHSAGRCKKIVVNADYIGEGKFIIRHQWKKTKKKRILE